MSKSKPQLLVSPPWAAAPADAEAAPGGGPGQTLLEPEYADAYNAYAKAPTPKNATGLLNAVQPVLSEAVKSYAGSEVGAPTTMAHAKSLALQAFDRYDPSRAKLRTHLLSHLRGLRRQTARASGGLYVPEAYKIDAQRIDTALPELREELGREPSTAELADHLHMDVNRIERARKATGFAAGSQVGGGTGVEQTDPASWNMWLRVVHADLHPIDQTILEYSTGLFGRPVLSGNQIAKKLRLSPGAVSQRRTRIQQMIDERDTFMGRHPG